MIRRSRRKPAGIMTPLWLVPSLAVALAASAGPAAAQAHGDSVWVNTRSGVYHCPGSHSYGTSKRGQYLPEATAVGRGFKPAKGRSCAVRAARHDTTGTGAAAHGGQVWVDTRSHEYRCPGSSKYGQGGHGVYMTESAALAAGNRPHNGRGCR
jgi:hypothetical protein